MTDPHSLIAADKAHTWHPFTQMRDWCAPEHEPLVLVSGKGAVLRDSEGREYSMAIPRSGRTCTAIAIRESTPRFARNSPRRAHLLPRLHQSARGSTRRRTRRALSRRSTLSRVFFSDDGSTAIEVAVKMALQYWRQRGQPERRVFVSFRDAYHGDTLGAASLGGIDLFQGSFGARGLLVERVASLEALGNVKAEDIAGSSSSR